MLKRDRKTSPLITIFLIILCVLFVLPFIMVVSISLSNEADIVQHGYKLIPMNIDTAAYKYIFDNPRTILNAYKITIIFSLMSMVLSTFLMALIAYPLSRTTYKHRNKISFILFFTMLFGGGMVPNYILITQYLKLADTIWVYVLPGLISPWSVFMIRTFFQGLPDSIVESAYVDGASEFRIFLQIVIPLSKPVLATIALRVFLGQWNNWGTSMLYINNDELISLQYLLQRIMNNVNLIQQASDEVSELIQSTTTVPSETVRMAMAVVVAGPALFIFPFFQKYFVKGLTVGSVKG